MSGVCSVLAPSRICSYTVGLRARSVKHVALSSVSGTNETVGWLEERFVYLEICLLRECFQLWPDVASGLQTASSLHISRIYWPSRTGVRQIINHGMSSAHVRLDGVSCPHPLARGARRRPGNASLPALLSLSAWESDGKRRARFVRVCGFRPFNLPGISTVCDLFCGPLSRHFRSTNLCEPVLSGIGRVFASARTKLSCFFSFFYFICISS